MVFDMGLIHSSVWLLNSDKRLLQITFNYLGIRSQNAHLSYLNSLQKYNILIGNKQIVCFLSFSLIYKLSIGILDTGFIPR